MPSRELLNLRGITLLKHTCQYGKQSLKNNSDLQCHAKITLTFRPSVNDSGKFVANEPSERRRSDGEAVAE